ncbi:hypothetical protein DL768_009084 [Monosporascus sp. mg162]|nr:hypothetical protein DL768_009084 [Monosporascus sp. mg162]
MSTPSVKLETSPAESFLSTPSEIYPSLFDTSATINPVESVMTPPASTDLVSTPAVPASTPAATPTPDATAPATSETTEKKPVKKRKSWGQVLPEPKTNLPPRKRAKTEDEKEQRRVERVLRNRRAAQSSRERKRQEVEALEQRCKQLEAALISRENTVNMLMEEMKKLRRNSCAGSPASSAFESFHPSPLTLSQPLFPSSTDEPTHGGSGAMDDFILMPESNNGTLDPASLSPELNPVADNIEHNSSPATAATTVPPTTAVASSDVTQHPAAMLCDPQSPSAVDRLLGDALVLPASFDLDSWGVENQLSPSADPVNFEYDHLASDSSPQFQEFDFEQFLSSDDSGAAPGATAANGSVAQEPESTFSLFDSETQVSSEAFNQQPHPGASLNGCDDGVIAIRNEYAFGTAREVSELTPLADDADSERPLSAKPKTAAKTESAGDAGENAATAHGDSRALGIPRPGTPAPNSTAPSFQPRAGGGTCASGTFSVARSEPASYPGRPTGFLFGLPPPYAPFVARPAPPSQYTGQSSPNVSGLSGPSPAIAYCPAGTGRNIPLRNHNRASSTWTQDPARRIFLPRGTPTRMSRNFFYRDSDDGNESDEDSGAPTEEATGYHSSGESQRQQMMATATERTVIGQYVATVSNLIGWVENTRTELEAPELVGKVEEIEIELERIALLLLDVLSNISRLIRGTSASRHGYSRD